MLTSTTQYPRTARSSGPELGAAGFVWVLGARGGDPLRRGIAVKNNGIVWKVLRPNTHKVFRLK